MDKTRIALEALITEREGMIAENTRAAVIGNSPTYRDVAFTILASRMRELIAEADSVGESGEEGGLPGTIYLVIQRRIGSKRDDLDSGAIIGGFAFAEDGYGWIKRQHNPEAYFLEPLKVIGKGD